MAVSRHGAPEILNTDQGSQFTSPAFTAYVGSLEKTRFSMDGKGRAIDNISLNGSGAVSNTRKSTWNHRRMARLYTKIKWYEFYNTERGIRH